MGHRDLVCAQQVGELQDVGRPVLLPLERAKLLGRRADPIAARVCRRCLEQTGFQACLPLCGFTAILPALLGSLSSILSALVCEKLQECRHL
jgi:hypothetical protein